MVLRNIALSKKSMSLSRLWLFLAYFALISLPVLSQVGVNTIDPTKDLDINGELRVRQLPAIDNPRLVAVDEDGNIGVSNVFLPSDVGSVVATDPVDFELAQSTPPANIIRDDIDLGMSIDVNIPAGREAFVIINYSVPMGVVDRSSPTGHYGIRFLRNGIEEQAGSRKFTFNLDETSVNMVTVGAIYTENLAPAATDRTITFTLNGYIEQLIATTGTHLYRFNMWQANGPNFNWGRATITKQVFVR